MEGRSQLSGIPRVAEIIDASKNIKTACMTLRLDTEELAARGCTAELYARSLEHCLLVRLVTSYEVEECRTSVGGHPEDSILVTAERACYGIVADQASTTVLRLTLNMRLLKRRGLVPNVVLKSVLLQHPGLIGVSSPSGSLLWVLRLKVAGGAENSHAENAAVYAKVLGATVVGGKAEIELAELCKGSKVTFCKGDDDGLIEEEEIVIETAGSALQVVATEPEIDWVKCSSNDVLDVYNTLGIEAARVVIFHELRNMVSGDSGKVSDRHVMMVATTMTFYGMVMPMSRHGINRIADTGPLLRCSFEETSEVLTDAGVYGEAEHHMRGISQSIMMGKTPYIGTGCLDVLQSKSSTSPSGVSPEHSVLEGVISSTPKRILSQSRFRGQQSHCLAIFPTKERATVVGCSAQDDMDLPPPLNSPDSGKRPQYMAGDVGRGCNMPGSIPESMTGHEHPPQSLETELRDIMRRMPFVPPRSPKL